MKPVSPNVIVLVSIMIYAGSALMPLNIIRYGVFIRHMKEMETSGRGRVLLFLPPVLLVLFLLGYLLLALLGRPDLLVAAILLGGSVIVLIVLSLLFYGIELVRENERRLAGAHSASNAKTIFFSNMSHDIRTPLNAITGYTQLALRPGTSQEEMRRFLEKIASSGRYLLALINDVLEMSRIESGKLELEPTETDLCAVMSEAREMFASQMESKRIDYTVETASLASRRVLRDRNRLNRVLLNLISNALKFTPEGGSVTVLPDGASAAEGACPCQSGTPELRFDGLRLLLAEDNEVNREIARLMLEGAGFVLDTVENGRLAVEWVAASRRGYYRAVLMDVQMPEMNGYEATRAIRALPDTALAAIPVIAMPSNAFREDIRTEEEAGMTAHISKPLERQEMLRTLAALVGDRAAQEPDRFV